ncbi:MAG TPA: GIY-YIG nuclease family protein [Gammaproteobacteria bacterium]|nr:GIY-YIG nuclease family protein [Gammaproteobacteria bacterium]
MAKSGNWFVYILRCTDNSLYTGVTTDISKRLDQHNGILKNGAKYTRARQPVTLVYQETLASRSLACQREAAIKRLKKTEKEQLIAKTTV